MPRSHKELVFTYVELSRYCCGLVELGGIDLIRPSDSLWFNNYHTPKSLPAKFPREALFAVTQVARKKLTRAMLAAGFTPLVNWKGEYGKQLALWFKWPKRSRKKTLVGKLI